MYGTNYVRVSQGQEILTPHFLAGCLAVYGTLMGRDPAVGTTPTNAGVSNMLPATGDFVGMLTQHVCRNATGTMVMPSAPNDQVGGPGVIPGILAGNPSFGGDLGSIPLPSYLEQEIMGVGNLYAQIGQAVSLLRWDSTAIAECESAPSKAVADYTGMGQVLITSGTGAITTSTAQQTELSVLNGRWRVAQSGDVVRGRVDCQVPPLANAANVAIRINGVSGYVK